MQERKKKSHPTNLKPKQDAKNQLAKGKVSTTERVFFTVLSSLSAGGEVFEPEPANRHILISAHKPLLAFTITSTPAKGPSHYLKERLA